MGGFDHNAVYLWTIIVIGLGVPVALAVYAHLRAHLARRQLARLQKQDD